jgi:hypothetical protein
MLGSAEVLALSSTSALVAESLQRSTYSGNGPHTSTGTCIQASWGLVAERARSDSGRVRGRFPGGRAAKAAEHRSVRDRITTCPAPRSAVGRLHCGPRSSAALSARLPERHRCSNTRSPCPSAHGPPARQRDSTTMGEPHVLSQGVITGCPQCSQLLGWFHFTQVFLPQYLFWHSTFTFSPDDGIVLIPRLSCLADCCDHCTVIEHCRMNISCPIIRGSGSAWSHNSTNIPIDPTYRVARPRCRRISWA